MKAYKVCCVDDDHGAIVVFSESSKGLKYQNSENCDCEFIDRHVLRAKEFDKYSPGPLTPKEYLENGWYWHCGGCDNEQVTVEDSPIYVEDMVFCGESCLRDNYAFCKKHIRGHESFGEELTKLDRWLSLHPEFVTANTPS